MNKFSKIIKKKNKPRWISGVWLFLLMIELICPVFGHEAADDAEFNSARAASVYVSENIAKSTDDTPDTPSMTACDEQHENKIVCHDECLCHSTAIPGGNSVTNKESVEIIARIPHNYQNSILNFLPPPYHPPKNS